MEKSRPYVILSGAMSIDGKIATKTRHSKLSSRLDLARLHTLRSKMDAVLIGKNTAILDNPLLTVRRVKGKNPIRIILDSKATIPLNSKIVKSANKIATIVVVSQQAPKTNIKKLEEKGLNMIVCGKERIDLKKLLRILYQRGIRKVLLEGGGITNWNFLREKLVDEILVTVTPFIIGGSNAISLVEGFGFDKVSRPNSFKLNKIVRIKNEVVLKYVS